MESFVHIESDLISFDYESRLRIIKLNCHRHRLNQVETQTKLFQYQT